MEPIAPLGRIVDTSQQLCTYSPGDTDATACSTPATWHIAWDADLENSLACDEHMLEAQRRFVYVDRHQVGHDCSMPASTWYFDEKRCGYPDDPETATVALSLSPQRGRHASAQRGTARALSSTTSATPRRTQL